MTNEFRNAYLMAVAVIIGIIGMALVLHEPLGWLHGINGTFPALQAPINAFVAIVAGAGVAVLAYSLLDRWRSREVDSPEERATTPGGLMAAVHPEAQIEAR